MTKPICHDPRIAGWKTARLATLAAALAFVAYGGAPARGGEPSSHGTGSRIPSPALNITKADVKTARTLAESIRDFLTTTQLPPTPLDKWPVFDSRRGVFVAANGHSLIRVNLSGTFARPTEYALVCPRMNKFFRAIEGTEGIASVEGPASPLPGHRSFKGGDVYTDLDVLYLQAVAGLTEDDRETAEELRDEIGDYLESAQLPPTPLDRWPVFDSQRGVYVAVNGHSLIRVDLPELSHDSTVYALLCPRMNKFFKVIESRGGAMSVEGPVEPLPGGLAFGGGDAYTDGDVLYLQALANRRH